MVSQWLRDYRILGGFPILHERWKNWNWLSTVLFVICKRRIGLNLRKQVVQRYTNFFQTKVLQTKLSLSTLLWLGRRIQLRRVLTLLTWEQRWTIATFFPPKKNQLKSHNSGCKYPSGLQVYTRILMFLETLGQNE